MRAGGEPQGDLFRGQPPSFPGPERPADRIGVIDVGSNSVRLVVFEGDRRSPAMLFNEKVMCALGAQLSRTGALDPQGRQRALAALRRYAAIAATLHVGALAGIATAAVREASDGTAFCAEAERLTGVRLRIASGVDEARLSAQGVIFGSPSAHGVAVDLGGASMELCRIEHGQVGHGVTTPLGPLRFRPTGSAKQLRAEIAGCLRPLAADFRLDGGRLYLVGGSWRALARAQIERTRYPLRVLHEYTLSAAAALDLADWAARSRPATITALPGVSESRAQVLPTAGRLLRALVEVLSPGEVMVSSFGLREGVCLEHLPEPVRREDPLLAACEAQERLLARAPGFGAELAAWVKGFLPPLDAREDRLIEAAARLADVNWRAHPDYRVNGCWETVTASPITDLGHAGRVFLGAVLASRYKRSRAALKEVGLADLLDERTAARASAIGSAFRLGSALSAASPGVLPSCRMSVADGRLELALEGPALEFDGEEADRRLRQLAAELGLQGVLRGCAA